VVLLLTSYHIIVQDLDIAYDRLVGLTIVIEMGRTSGGHEGQRPCGAANMPCPSHATFDGFLTVFMGPEALTAGWY
jgi:hypothetical protein